jgi:hypothetical protein
MLAASSSEAERFCLANTVFCVAGRSTISTRKKNMGKGNNSQKNDKKNKKPKQSDKKAAGKPSNKK